MSPNLQQRSIVCIERSPQDTEESGLFVSLSLCLFVSVRVKPASPSRSRPETPHCCCADSLMGGAVELWWWRGTVLQLGSEEEEENMDWVKVKLLIHI